MKAQLVKYTIAPGKNPAKIKVGDPSSNRAKLQRAANEHNRGMGDIDFDVTKPVITYVVEIAT